MKKILILTITIFVLIFLPSLSEFCVPFQPNSIYSGKLENLDSAKTVILDVPYIEQKDLYCSEASTAMILHYYGDNEITQEYVNENIAINFENMLPSLRDYLENCYYAAIDVEKLKNEIDEGDPVMIRISINRIRHTIVGVGYDENYIYVHDPEQGEYLKVKPETLLNYWVPVEDDEHKELGYLSIIVD